MRPIIASYEMFSDNLDEKMEKIMSESPLGNEVNDERLSQLVVWLKTIFKQDELDISVASADASFRRYFRILTPDHADAKSWVVMDAPPDKEDCKPFIYVCNAFLSMEVNVPKIYAKDLTQGFLVLSDFGSTCFLDKLNEQNVDSLYGDAMATLLHLQTHTKPKDVSFPPYDDALLMREMQLFPDWFLKKHMSIHVSSEIEKILNKTFRQLSDNTLSQPVVWVHRDFHSRNLMLLEKNNPGVIDFQDAVEGPITYDLVSLLRDCYIDWDVNRVENWVKKYWTKLQALDVCTDVAFDDFLKWFDWMGVQRHLKAIGIFSRLNYRDGKSGYLADIPRTLNYVVQVSKKYPELQAFHDFVSTLETPEPV